MRQFDPVKILTQEQFSYGEFMKLMVMSVERENTQVGGLTMRLVQCTLVEVRHNTAPCSASSLSPIRSVGTHQS
jgi:hypothetical protein